MDQLAAFLVNADGSERVIVGSYAQLTDRLWGWANTAKEGSFTQASLVPVGNLPDGITIDEDLR